MPTCGDCKLLIVNPRGEGYRCTAKKCGASKVTPDKDARRCKKFEPK